jgi:hypothetical protein
MELRLQLPPGSVTLGIFHDAGPRPRFLGTVGRLHARSVRGIVAVDASVSVAGSGGSTVLGQLAKPAARQSGWGSGRAGTGERCAASAGITATREKPTSGRCCVGLHPLSSRLFSVTSTEPSSAFAGFRFPPEVITVAVRWYLRYALSYRDVEELLCERGVKVDHVTVYRWV